MLLDYLTSSPQQSARTAAASLRILVKPQIWLQHRPIRPGRIIDAVAAREGRHS
jgi:hypothetical protein